jgi:autotransporter-associated beta strand protein/probable HAF family extracellular repeat protein
LIAPGTGCTFAQATGINDSGQICGYGSNASGQTDAFLLTPNGNWLTNGSGTWSVTMNWAGGQPQGNAVFGPVLTSGTATITLDSNRSLTSLSFSTTGGASYLISASGGSALTLANTATGTATISNSGGNNAIDAPIILGSNLSVSATTGSVLTIAGGISESGGSYSVNLIGGGELILSGSNDYTGGTTVSAGTLCVTDTVALPSGTSLTVGAGGAALFEPAAAADAVTATLPLAVTTVPEPSTIAILGAGALGLLAYARRAIRIPRSVTDGGHRKSLSTGRECRGRLLPQVPEPLDRTRLRE